MHMYMNKQELEEKIKQGRTECIKLHALNWFEEGEHKEFRFTPENIVELANREVVIIKDRVETTIYIPKQLAGEYFKYLRKRLGIPVTKQNYNKFGFTRVVRTGKDINYYRLVVPNDYTC